METMSSKNADKKKIGETGEALACRLLIEQGYCIEAQNFRCRTGEIDIIARKGEVLAFVEVKARSGTAYGLPCEAVNCKKRRRILRTAEYFLLLNPRYSELQPRMDIIEILRHDGEVYGRHIENAFQEV